MVTATDGPLLAVFAVVVRHGSFSAAARELKLSKSVISARVGLLEERCGARLLERTTRRMRITDAGAEVLEAATRVSDALAQLSRSLDTRQSEPSGVLRVSTTIDLASLLVAPTVARFVGAYPKVRVEILASDVSRDLLEDRVDLALRLGAPKATSFVARKLAVLAEPIVASPALAVAYRRVTRPRELAGAPWVRHSLLSGASMRFLGPGGATDELTPTIRAEANAGTTVVSLLLSGAGLGVMPEHALREHVHEGRLVVLGPGWTWKRVTLYALTPSGPSRSPIVAAFLAGLRAQLAHDALRWAPLV